MTSARTYANARAFNRGQSRYDAMSEPEDGPEECQECGGDGEIPVHTDPEGDTCMCPCCLGSGKVDEDGNPWSSDGED